MSALGLGCMGMALLDTGDFYGMGHNDMLVGEALKAVPREQVVVRRRDRLAEALGAASVTLSPADMAAIESAVPKGGAAGARYPDRLMAELDSEK